MSDSRQPDSSCCGGIPVLATGLGCALLLGVVWFAYVKHQPAPLGDGVRTAAQRVENLSKLREHEQTTATTYGWVDRQKETVRLPLSRAVELTIEELKSGPVAK